MAVTQEERLRSRLRLSEWTMENAAKVLADIAEIPAMRREIRRRIKAAKSMGLALSNEVEDQRRDYPDPPKRGRP